MRRIGTTAAIGLVVFSWLGTFCGGQTAVHGDDAGGTGGFAGTHAGGLAGASTVDGSDGVSEASVRPCGANGEPCCAGRSCNEGLGCLGPDDSTVCRSCGQLGQVCCWMAPVCGAGLKCSIAIDGPGGSSCTVKPDVTVTCVAQCDQPGGQYCGTIGDRCGGRLICGGCRQPGFTCGGTGVENLCGAPLDAGTCERATCQTRAGKYCGVIGDGCGGSLDCGGCPVGVSCGESGVPNSCGAPPDADWEPPPPVPPLPPPPPN